MNTNMYENPVLQRNIRLLSELGYIIVPPEEGRLACGDVGKGRMPDPSVIEKSIIELLNYKQDMKGRTVLVTAGPTREAIDPVRFISNNSTGKMGYAIARQAALRGAKVYLVSGPTILDTPAGVEKHDVISAEEMYNKVMELFPMCDIVIKAAAVADYSPMTSYSQKVKKLDSETELKLKRNPDILYELGKIKETEYLWVLPWKLKTF